MILAYNKFEQLAKLENMGDWSVSYKNTIIGQMLHMLAWLEFQRFVKDTKTKHHARGFTSWNHFV